MFNDPTIANANTLGFGTQQFYVNLYNSNRAFLADANYAAYNEYMNYYYGKNWTPDYTNADQTNSILNRSFDISTGKASAWYYSPYGLFANSLARRVREGANFYDLERQTIDFSKLYADGQKENVFIGRAIWLTDSNSPTGNDPNPLADLKTGISYINQSGGTFNINNSAALLNADYQISAAVDAEIQRLGGKNLFVFGGYGVLDISYAIGRKYNLVRSGGADRYETFNAWRRLYNGWNSVGLDPFKPSRNVLNQLVSNNEGLTLTSNSVYTISDGTKTIINSLSFDNAVKYILGNVAQMGKESNIDNRAPALIYKKGNAYFVVYCISPTYTVYQTIGEDFRNTNDMVDLVPVDLQIKSKDNTQFIDPNSLVPGTTYSLAFRVKNQGSTSFPTNFWTRPYLDGSHLGDVQLGPIPAGGYSNWVNVEFTPSSFGNHTLSVTADIYNQISETNETNNTSSLGAYAPMTAPLNSRLTMYEYDYKQNDTIYWMKPGSTIGVYTDGCYPSAYGIYPQRTYVLFAKDGSINSNSARQYADTTGKNKWGSEFDTYFNFINDGDKAYTFQYSGNNFLGHRHHLSAKTDGTSFKMYYTSSAFDMGTEIYPGYQDSGMWLKVDGQAPSATFSTNSNSSQSVDISINLQDTSSGVNKFRYRSSNDNGSTWGAWSSYTTISSYTQFHSATISFNNINRLKVQVEAVDNVGNSAIITSGTYEGLAINATLAPNPAMQGQKVKFNINTEGYAKELIIELPPMIAILDPLNAKLTKIIIEAPTHSDTMDYILPLNTQVTLDSFNNRLLPPYLFTVKAKRADGLERSVQLQLDVKGNVFDGIKTEIKQY